MLPRHYTVIVVWEKPECHLVQLHRREEKTDVSMAGISNTLQLIPKQSSLLNSTTGNRKNMYFDGTQLVVLKAPVFLSL